MTSALAKRAPARIDFLLKLLGVDLRRPARGVRELPRFIRTYRAFQRAAAYSERPIPAGAIYPCLFDRQEFSGQASGHYFHQDLLVARRIFANRPDHHVDIGSRVDGFVAHVATFRTIEVLDIRPLPSTDPHIVFTQADITSPDFALTDYCDSVSSLHAIEHFGLGRYGDPIDPDGHLKAIRAIYRLLQPAGQFYFSVPIGPLRTEFNGQRVFSLDYALEMLQPYFAIDNFSYVGDRGNLHKDVALDGPGVSSSFGCRFGCGIFELTSRKAA